MSLEELKERNIQLVTEKAVECFVERGIENTRVSDIAKAAGLTERSVYRYFPTKSDIVIAAALCYWARAKDYIASQMVEHSGDAMTGIEQIELILQSYANILLIDPKGVRFTLDAELVLNSVGKSNKVFNRPPERFEAHAGPLSNAVEHGLADGTVNPNVDVKQLYYNAYDSILGLMQRLTLGVPSISEIDVHARLMQMCRMFTQAFAAV